MNIDTFCEFEQIEEYEYSGWFGNPVEELFLGNNNNEEEYEDV